MEKIIRSDVQTADFPCCCNGDTVMAHSSDCCANCHDWNSSRHTCDDPGSNYWGKETSPSFVCSRYSGN